jgi:hypothetical protein
MESASDTSAVPSLRRIQPSASSLVPASGERRLLGKAQQVRFSEKIMLQQ